jgi:hypothetical protein
MELFGPFSSHFFFMTNNLAASKILAVNNVMVGLSTDAVFGCSSFVCHSRFLCSFLVNGVLLLFYNWLIWWWLKLAFIVPNCWRIAGSRHTSGSTVAAEHVIWLVQIEVSQRAKFLSPYFMLRSLFNPSLSWWNREHNTKFGGNSFAQWLTSISTTFR